jgi:hypothetical protein
VKRNPRIFLAGISILSLLLLTGCKSSYYWQNTSLQIKVNGTVDLSKYDPFESYTGLRRISTGARTAKILLNENFDGGNLSISGKYEDGYVKFDFKGHSMFQLCPDVVICQGDIFDELPVNQILNGQTYLQSGLSKLNALTNSSKSQGGKTLYRHNLSRGVTGNGGLCSIVPTLYTSTNPKFPGTGNVIFLVCSAAVPNATPITDYPGKNYVEVLMPYLNIGGVDDAPDKEPYLGYISGGVLNNSNTRNMMVVTQPTPRPSISPCPIFTYPPADASEGNSTPVLVPEPSARGC